ncbi:hypothetical protein C8R46DRAFT_1185080 [Mycena filopes]|nr:hypothetical protein C8R46DRAFT_1185080 [Mycena filopes]
MQGVTSQVQQSVNPILMFTVGPYMAYTPIEHPIPSLMLSFKGTFTQITSHRLGYTSQRPYPWRWATPAILGVFLLISVFLAIVNIPLSAYETVQESTYRPNDTLPPLLFSKLVPGMLQSPEDSFAPHVLTVGDTLVANNSIFNFTIIEAWDENSAPVSSFSYYNNPFSDGCDIANITFNTTVTGDSTLLVDVRCLIPTLFRMTSTIQYNPILGAVRVSDLLREILLGLWFDLGIVVSLPVSPLQWNLTGLTATVIPCCDCDRTLPSVPSLLLELPCRAQPAQLVGSHWSAALAGRGDYDEQGSFSTVIFGSELSEYLHPGDPIYSVYGFLTLPSVNNVFQNMFQSVYHLARMELGIIVENQIFNSPQMFNASISTIDLPSSLPEIREDILRANESRAFTSNTTLMKEWADTVQLFNTTDRVPVINYLRPVPRRKPLGSALTSVFVSTFAMVSVLWTVFSLIAGVIAAKFENVSTHAPYAPSSLEDRVETNTVTIDTHGIAIAQMELSFARMHLALRKRGLFEDDNEEGGPEASIPCTSGHGEDSTLLVHHKQSDSYSAV